MESSRPECSARYFMELFTEFKNNAEWLMNYYRHFGLKAVTDLIEARYNDTVAN